MRWVGKPAVEIGNGVKNMNTMKSFEQWVWEDFFEVYIKFQEDHNFLFKEDGEEYNNMGWNTRLKKILSHFTDIKIQPKCFIKMPCMYCGKRAGDRKNHVIGDANYLEKYLSRNGHVYVLKKDYKRDFDGKDVTDPLFWSSGNFWWKCTGHRTSDVTFRGFCKDCDNKLFLDIDGDMKNKKDFFKQIYRSACSLYFRTLEHSIKTCYITDVSQDVGLIDNGWLDIIIQTRYDDIEREQPVNAKTVRAEALLGAYHRYCVVKELQAGLDSEEPVVNVGYLRVENPSIYCGFVCERRLPFREEFMMVNNLYRKVDDIDDVFVVLPLAENETVVLNVTLPLGIKECKSWVEYLFASERPDIVLTQDIVKLGLGSLCDLYMSPRFYDSLPSEHLDLITDASKHSDLPAISLFDMDWRRIGRNLWTRK